ncbi:MAG: CoA-binding protein, partial [Burkholderiales bacterium]|nr:CoA-binding protein [Burkholderiales bacterium]
MFENPDAAARCALLKKTKPIAVVGLSPNASRPSHGVSKALQEFGFRVIPVHPAATEILGEKAYPSL